MTEFHVFQRIKLWALEYAKNPSKNEIEYIKRAIYSCKQANPLVANTTSFEYQNIDKAFDNILKDKNYKNVCINDMENFLNNIHDYIMNVQSRRVLDAVFC